MGNKPASDSHLTSGRREDFVANWPQSPPGIEGASGRGGEIRQIDGFFPWHKGGPAVPSRFCLQLETFSRRMAAAAPGGCLPWETFWRSRVPSE